MAYKEKKEAIKYNNEFNKRAYDRINLTVPKGQKEVIQASAAECGESLNEYIKKAITERMERQAAGEGTHGGVVMGFSPPVPAQNVGSGFTSLAPPDSPTGQEGKEE